MMSKRENSANVNRLLSGDACQPLTSCCASRDAQKRSRFSRVLRPVCLWNCLCDPRRRRDNAAQDDFRTGSKPPFSQSHPGLSSTLGSERPARNAALRRRRRAAPRPRPRHSRSPLRGVCSFAVKSQPAPKAPTPAADTRMSRRTCRSPRGQGPCPVCSPRRPQPTEDTPRTPVTQASEGQSDEHAAAICKAESKPAPQKP